MTARPARPVGALLAAAFALLSSAPVLSPALSSACAQDGDAADIRADEATYYSVDHLPVPAGEVLEVGGLDFLSDGRMVLSTRRGQVWMVEDPLADDPADARFTLFAEGLDEGLGLAVIPDDVVDGRTRETVWVVQRGELSRLLDTDGDGRCDRIDTLNDDWGLSGNYHEFAYGLPRDADGDVYVSLNVAFFADDWWVGKSPDPWRGWVLRIDRNGRSHPVASGFRSPCGLGFNAAGDLFATDNQGDWMAACPVMHVVPGGFYGHPSSLAWTDEYRRNGARPSLVYPPEQPRRPAAVWLPYKWSRSAGNLVPDSTGGAFGPFDDQLFVAELTNGLIVRVALEKVRGEYQGACFLFRRHVGSAVRVDFAPDGTLMAGLTNRGWGGLPPGDGIARLRWTGATPFEMHSVHLLQDGFEVRFTKPLAADLDLGPHDIALSQYDYDYWWEYGSPERHTTKVDVTDVRLSGDRRTLTLRTAGLTPAMVARCVLSRVVAADGSPLLHDEFAYTINQLPAGPLTTEHVVKPVPPPPAKGANDEGWLRLTYGDALDAWDAAGWSLVDAALDPDDPTKLHAWEGVGALVNVGQGPAGDFVGRYPLGSGEYHVEFMLPEGGRSAVYLQGRYGLALGDDAAVDAGRAPATGTLLGHPDLAAVAPDSDGYQGAGVWHGLDLDFEAPRFDARGRKVEPARLLHAALDGVQLHENVVLPGPTAGARFADESPLGPLVIVGTDGPVALRTLRFKARGPQTGEPVDAGGDDALAESGTAPWVSIFNGSDLDGWSLSPDAEPDPLAAGLDPDDVEASSAALGGWRVEDGILIGSGDRSHLFSPRADYTDLEFRAKVRINDGGNSGMYFRVTHGPGWPAGYEAQVNASYHDPQKSGSLYALAPVHVELVPPGVWFEQHITCRDTDAGTHVSIRVNGVLVAEFVDAERRHASGHVAFQQHHDGSVVEYRDVAVRDLSAR